MESKIIMSMLWKKVMDATIDTLTGQSAGQYHIELGRGEGIEDFFDGCERNPSGVNGGFNIDLPIHRVGGESPVEDASIPIKYLGDSSSRRTWIISSQRPETAYPLWREDRAFPGGASGENYIVIVKDSTGDYHCRWINNEDFGALPGAVRDNMGGKPFGVMYGISSSSSKRAMEIIDALKQETNVLLYGPPGTGKTHLMQEVNAGFNAQHLSLDVESEKQAFSFQAASALKLKSSFVTFHQNYAYEDFVIGLRPDTETEKLLSLSPQPGRLLEMAEFSRIPGNASLLMIDEINRGNVSRIFGEFITLMEPGKRLGEDGEELPTTVSIDLPYISNSTSLCVDVDGEQIEITNPFSLPARLYTLASMNSVDKSVAPLDAAIRRRFHIINLSPSADELKSKFEYCASDDTEIEEIKRLAVHLLEYVNDSIAFFKGKDYQLGQWYFYSLCREFSDVELCKSALVDVWVHKILPQLEELFHGRIEQISKILKLDEIKSKDCPIDLVIPEVELDQLGASAYLRHVYASNDDQLRYISRICNFSFSGTAVPEKISDASQGE